MKDAPPLEHPMLVIVTGCPGSGKSSLAQPLAHEIRCPLISRDEIKEGYVNTLKTDVTGNREVTTHVYETFFETIELLLNKKITLVAEAAFQHHLWSAKLNPLRAIASLKIIHCSVDPKIAESRFNHRIRAEPERATFHDDVAVMDDREMIERLIYEYTPPLLDVPMLTVDTTEGYDPTFEEIVVFVTETV